MWPNYKILMFKMNLPYVKQTKYMIIRNEKSKVNQIIEVKPIFPIWKSQKSQRQNLPGYKNRWLIE